MIKSGRYAVAKVSTPTSPPLHDYVHKKVILDAVLDLNKVNSITSFTNGLCVLINNAKMVDKHFAICSVKEGGSVMWRLAGDIPINVTSLCSHINIWEIMSGCSRGNVLLEIASCASCASIQ